MKTYDKIKDEKLQYESNRGATKASALSSRKTDIYIYIYIYIYMSILLVNKYFHPIKVE